jgi:hypothetical protein
MTFAGGLMFNFVSGKTDTGWPMDQPDSIEEALDTNGVNGRRWRELFVQHRPFIVSTLSQCSDFNEAINVANSIRYNVRRFAFARLIWRHPIRVQAYVNVHVGSVNPVPYNGPLAGDVAANMGAAIRTLWMCEATGGFG